MYVAGVVAAVCFLLVGCSRQSSDSPELKEQREKVAQEISQRIDQLHNNLQVLGQQAGELGEEAKEEYQKASANIEIQLQQVRLRSAYLKNNTGEEWEQVKTEVSKALDGLEQKYDQLKTDQTK